ncbi:MAG: hypothetical protein [Caudoviricetes sp.]|nr:MAG: hypothetical protein [Caudoviricetes sp.]
MIPAMLPRSNPGQGRALGFKGLIFCDCILKDVRARGSDFDCHQTNGSRCAFPQGEQSISVGPTHVSLFHVVPSWELGVVKVVG